MPNRLMQRLEGAGSLTVEDRRRLEAILRPAATFSGREVVMSEGEPCGAVHVLLSGWACRFKRVSGAARQIVAFLVPGDHTPLHSSLGDPLAYGLCTLTRCEITSFDGLELDALIRSRPGVARAFHWSTRVDDAILQEWLVNVGRRPAERRVAHLLCELLRRLQAVGLAEPDGFALPLTQSTLGDALGLSSAHVNRTLQSLRARGLVFFEDGQIRVKSVASLERFAGFDARYAVATAARKPVTV